MLLVPELFQDLWRVRFLAATQICERQSCVISMEVISLSFSSMALPPVVLTGSGQRELELDETEVVL